MNQDNKFIRSLIQSSLQGNNSALEQLFQMNLSKVYTLAFRLTSNFDSAEKVTENVFVEAWKQLGHLREDATFSSWISGIAVYQSLNFLREKDDPKKIESSDLPSKHPLETTILELPKNERISTILHYLEKYTIDEVADLLAVSRADAAKFIEEGENKVIARSRDIDSQKSFLEEIQKLRVDTSPKKDLINEAFVAIYRTKSEDEVRDKYLSEHNNSTELKKEKDDSENTGGLGGIFKKILPRSKNR